MVRGACLDLAADFMGERGSRKLSRPSVDLRKSHGLLSEYRFHRRLATPQTVRRPHGHGAIAQRTDLRRRPSTVRSVIVTGYVHNRRYLKAIICDLPHYLSPAANSTARAQRADRGEC